MELCRSIDSAKFRSSDLRFKQVTTKRDAFGVALIVIGMLLLVEQPRVRHGRA